MGKAYLYCNGKSKNYLTDYISKGLISGNDAFERSIKSFQKARSKAKKNKWR